MSTEEDDDLALTPEEQARADELEAEAAAPDETTAEPEEKPDAEPEEKPDEADAEPEEKPDESDADDESEKPDETAGADDDVDDMPDDLEAAQDRIREMSKRDRAQRRQLYRARELRRQAKARQDAAADLGDETGDEDESTRIPLQRNEETGEPELDMADLAEAARGTEQPKAQPDARAALVDSFEDKGAAEDAMFELDTAYSWLERQVGVAVQDAGFVPEGMDGLLEFAEEEGISERFEDKFPGITIEQLAQAKAGALPMRKLVRDYMGEAPERVVPKKTAERREARDKVESKPRAQSRVGAPGGEQSVGKKRFAELTPEETLAMSDEDMAELDRQLAAE